MNLSTTAKILVGLVTAIVTLLPVAFIALMIGVSSGGPFAASFAESFFDIGFEYFNALFVAVCVLNLLIYALVAFYMVHIIKNDEGSQVVRILLAIGLFMFPYLAMPVYYFVYVLPESPPGWALAPKPDSTQSLSSQP